MVSQEPLSPTGPFPSLTMAFLSPRVRSLQLWYIKHIWSCTVQWVTSAQLCCIYEANESPLPGEQGFRWGTWSTVVSFPLLIYRRQPCVMAVYTKRKVSWNVLTRTLATTKSDPSHLGRSCWHSASFVFPFWSLVVLNLSLHFATSCKLSRWGYSFGCLTAIENWIQNQSSATQPILSTVSLTPQGKAFWLQGRL